MWWRRLHEFLNSKTFCQSIHNPSFTCNAVLVTDINAIGKAAAGIKKKIEKLVGDTIKVCSPRSGKCHMNLDESCLSLIVTEWPPKSDLYRLINIIGQIQNHLPTFIKQHSLPDYHGIIEIAIRVEIPSIRAFSRENNGERLTDLLMEWGQHETQVIDLLCNVNEKKEKGLPIRTEKQIQALQRKEKRETYMAAAKERAKAKLAAKADSSDSDLSSDEEGQVIHPMQFDFVHHMEMANLEFLEEFEHGIQNHQPMPLDKETRDRIERIEKAEKEANEKAIKNKRITGKKRDNRKSSKNTKATDSSEICNLNLNFNKL